MRGWRRRSAIEGRRNRGRTTKKILYIDPRRWFNLWLDLRVEQLLDLRARCGEEMGDGERQKDDQSRGEVGTRYFFLSSRDFH
jgi:hypothetical protein